MRILFLFICCLMVRPVSGQAPGEALQRKAQQAYQDREYEQAAAAYGELVEKFPASPHRRQAVRMLGMINDFNLYELDRAVRWYQQYLEEFPGPGRINTTVKWRLKLLSGLGKNRPAYIAFQKAKVMQQFTPARVEALEKIVSTWPGYGSIHEVYSALAYEYRGSRQYGRSLKAFEMSDKNNPAAPQADRSPELILARQIRNRSVLARAAWIILILVAGITVYLKPWQYLSARTVKYGLRLILIWLVVCIVLFIAYMVKIRYYTENPFTTGDTVLFFLLNLGVIVWMFLLAHAPGLDRTGKHKHWLVPAVSLILTVCIFYLFIYHQREWILMMFDFLEQYGDFLK